MEDSEKKVERFITPESRGFSEFEVYEVKSFPVLQPDPSPSIELTGYKIQEIPFDLVVNSSCQFSFFNLQNSLMENCHQMVSLPAPN